MRRNWSYLAGLIDGDGFIMFTKHKHSKVAKGFCWRLVLGISSSNHEFLRQIQRVYGGYLEPVGYMTVSGHTCYQLRFRLFEIRDILPRILPTLILKRKRGQLALQATSMMGSWLSRRYGIDLEKIYEEMKTTP